MAFSSSLAKTCPLKVFLKGIKGDFYDEEIFVVLNPSGYNS